MTWSSESAQITYLLLFFRLSSFSSQRLLLTSRSTRSSSRCGGAELHPRVGLLFGSSYLSSEACIQWHFPQHATAVLLRRITIMDGRRVLRLTQLPELGSRLKMIVAYLRILTCATTASMCKIIIARHWSIRIYLTNQNISLYSYPLSVRPRVATRCPFFLRKHRKCQVNDWSWDWYLFPDLILQTDSQIVESTLLAFWINQCLGIASHWGSTLACHCSWIDVGYSFNHCKICLAGLSWSRILCWSNNTTFVHRALSHTSTLVLASSWRHSSVILSHLRSLPTYVDLPFNPNGKETWLCLIERSQCAWQVQLFSAWVAESIWRLTQRSGVSLNMWIDTTRQQGFYMVKGTARTHTRSIHAPSNYPGKVEEWSHGCSTYLVRSGPTGWIAHDAAYCHSRPP